jgi:hypothetical protein
MSEEIKTVKIGLLLVLFGLIFGVGMGISFGIQEDRYKAFIAEGVAAHPDLHDSKSPAKIWRYAQRAHFHATGIAAFSLGLLMLIMHAHLKPCVKQWAAIAIGMGSLYPLSWFTMFLLAPTMGREAAHGHVLTELLALSGIGGLLIGISFLITHLSLGWFQAHPDH